MIDLLQSAANDEKNESHTFFLEGDLCQMSAQRRFLSERGFELKQNNVYPCLKKEDVSKALQLIWEQRVEGWWHYEELYVEHSICTKEEYRARLHRS